MTLSQKDIDEAPWIGESRADVQALFNANVLLQYQVDYYKEFLNKAGVLGVAIDDITHAKHVADLGSRLGCEMRVMIARKLLEGTSHEVIP